MTEEYGHISDAFDMLPEEELLKTDQQPITPPSALVEQWVSEIWYKSTPVLVTASDLHITARAVQWGADQELDACCEEMKSLPSPLGIPFGEMASNALRAARRPKPPSLKKQALAVMSKESWSIEEEEIILRALKQLPDDTTP